MPIFHYNDQRLSEVKMTTFGDEGMQERNDLQAALKKNISVISDELLIISEEFSDWDESQRRIDLLAIDKQANIVVIEIKRDTGNFMELQAIRYAAMISMLTWQKATETFSQFLKNEYPNEERNAEQEILDFLDWSEAQEDDFGSETHIVLISADFSNELTTSVMWLNDNGLNIKCVQISPHKFGEEILINVQQIIPLPEAEDYQVRLRRKGEEKRVARKSRDYTRYLFKDEVYSKRRLVLAVIKDWIESNTPKNFSELTKVFPQNIRVGGIFKPLSEAGRLHFIKEEDHIKFDDGSIYVISTQWGGGQHKHFVEIAQKIGYDIEAVN